MTSAAGSVHGRDERWTATRSGIIELMGHDPYDADVCDRDCRASHEADRCSLCGKTFGEAGAPVVGYVLGCEVADADCGCYAYSEPDKWACYCVECEELSMERHL